MLKTIMLGSRIMVQGRFVKELPDGRLMLRVDGKIHIGWPVTHAKAA
ncbi:hypothetical protein [Aliiroseovarius marinus]